MSCCYFPECKAIQKTNLVERSTNGHIDGEALHWWDYVCSKCGSVDVAILSMVDEAFLDRIEALEQTVQQIREEAHG